MKTRMRASNGRGEGEPTAAILGVEGDDRELLRLLLPLVGWTFVEDDAQAMESASIVFCSDAIAGTLAQWRIDRREQVILVTIDGPAPDKAAWLKCIVVSSPLDISEMEAILLDDDLN